MSLMDTLIQSTAQPALFFALPLGALVTWRLWRFTVAPYLYPKEPKVLPYWIPGMKLVL